MRHHSKWNFNKLQTKALFPSDCKMNAAHFLSFIGWNVSSLQLDCYLINQFLFFFALMVFENIEVHVDAIKILLSAKWKQKFFQVFSNSWLHDLIYATGIIHKVGVSCLFF